MVQQIQTACVWVMQTGRKRLFRGGSVESACHCKVWIIHVILNIVHMVAWERKYTEAVGYFFSAF